MKRSIIFCLVTPVICFLHLTIYAQNSDESIVGKWKQNGGNYTFEFKQDGTYTLNSDSGTYSVNGDIITFVETKYEQKITIKDNTLTLSRPDGMFAQTYTRVTADTIAQEQKAKLEMVQEMWQKMAQTQQSKLSDGEVLYVGATKFDNCEAAVFSFVLTEKQDSVKHFAINLKGIKNSSVRSSETAYSAVAVVKDSGLDYSHQYGGEFRIVIKKGLGEDVVEGELSCSYIVRSNEYPYESNVKLGTALIEFKKQ